MGKGMMEIMQFFHVRYACNEPVCQMSRDVVIIGSLELPGTLSIVTSSLNYYTSLKLRVRATKTRTYYSEKWTHGSDTKADFLREFNML